MNQIKWPFLMLALAAVASMMWTGIAVAQRSLFGTIASIIILIIIMGFGFMRKKKMREGGKL